MKPFARSVSLPTNLDHTAIIYNAIAVSVGANKIVIRSRSLIELSSFGAAAEDKHQRLCIRRLRRWQGCTRNGPQKQRNYMKLHEYIVCTVCVPYDQVHSNSVSRTYRVERLKHPAPRTQPTKEIVFTEWIYQDRHHIFDLRTFHAQIILLRQLQPNIQRSIQTLVFHLLDPGQRIARHGHLVVVEEAHERRDGRVD